MLPTPRQPFPATRSTRTSASWCTTSRSTQIRTLDCGKLLSGYPDAEVVQNNKIATLPEVFALTDSYGADVRYNIETKVEADKPETSASPQEFVDIILAAVRAAGKVDKVEIQSFDWRTLPMVRQAEPSIPLVALWDETTWVPNSPWLAGVNPAVVGDPITGATMVGANILSPGYSVPYGLTPNDPGFTARRRPRRSIDRAHALGLKVIPWTINDADAMRAQIAAGADGIITDYPTRLRSVMAELGMPLPPAYRVSWRATGLRAATAWADAARRRRRWPAGSAPASTHRGRRPRTAVPAVVCAAAGRSRPSG